MSVAPTASPAENATDGALLTQITRELLQSANRGDDRMAFLQRLSHTLVDLACCQALELWASDQERHYCWSAGSEQPGHYVVPLTQGALPSTPAGDRGQTHWTDQHPDATQPVQLTVPIHITERDSGYLVLHGQRDASCLAQQRIPFWEIIAQLIGIAIASRRNRTALVERVKELSCVYEIARLAEQQELSLPDILQRAVDLLPPAWQYPAIASARIVCECDAYVSRDFRMGPHSLSADLMVRGEQIGTVRVFYSPRDGDDTHSFLLEESHLLGAVARELGLLIEHKRAQEEHQRLQAQLRHADRLATIGQLAAGVAHELNEPLGTILGFAQLMEKHEHLPADAADDLGRIVNAALFAREVTRKLMIFARRTPARRGAVTLNQVVHDSLALLDSRCAKEGQRLEYHLAPDLPDVPGDAAQLRQVVVNLVVNAIQATPRGGTIAVYTAANGQHISLLVEDTGCGIDSAARSSIFLPFYTTKDVGHGTGLGLSVVHGIVTSHGGSVRVTSTPGQGSCFEVRLPQE